ncbi:MAG: TRAP transporter small permease [Rhodospirillales bacterium]|nr:TRAP transporter small permease [Rhodospirillales bacterium]
MKPLDLAARGLTCAAAIFLVAMMGLNVVDVALRSIFNAPIFGTYEIIELMLAAVAFLAIPETFLRGEHVSIELIDQIVPKRVAEIMQVIGMGATVLFFGLLVYYMIPPAIDYIEFNEVSFDLHMPMIWRGSLVLIGITASLIAVGAIFWRDFSRLFDRRSRR